MVSAAFSLLVEQTQAVELLTQAIERDRIAPAYLFAGPDGVGRKLAARLFLDALLQQRAGHRRRQLQDNHPDILWVEPTYQHQGKAVSAAALAEKGVALPKGRPQVRLEQIRDIARFLSQAPLESSRLLVVVEGAQTMGEAAANGLLKTLEEPGNGTLILIAPTLESLLPTIVSRCQRVPFYGLSAAGLATVLERLGLAALLGDGPILAMAQGSPGRATQYWEKLQTIPAEVLERFQLPPQAAKDCLELARHVDKALDLETQLWLLDYLQQRYWAMGRAIALKPLEQAKTYLTQYVQPQLVWEVTLLQLANP
ncbi:DNA polymerase III subunit delta' [Altericista sp. CCNU0014]|uniref:DNA polymerase III subunit delta' n=1 Tax=Altericista sp. CCNU0014 TaxID=3082949 RepID=UPI00384AC8B9